MSDRAERKVLDRFDPSTKEALETLATIGRVLLVSLHESEPGSNAETLAWDGLNLNQRIILRLVMPPCEKSLKARVTVQEIKAKMERKTPTPRKTLR